MPRQSHVLDKVCSTHQQVHHTNGGYDWEIGADLEQGNEGADVWSDAALRHSVIHLGRPLQAARRCMRLQERIEREPVWGDPCQQKHSQGSGLQIETGFQPCTCNQKAIQLIICCKMDTDMSCLYQRTLKYNPSLHLLHPSVTYRNSA